IPPCARWRVAQLDETKCHNAVAHKCPRIGVAQRVASPGQSRVAVPAHDEMRDIRTIFGEPYELRGETALDASAHNKLPVVVECCRYAKRKHDCDDGQRNASTQRDSVSGARKYCHHQSD